MRDPLTSLGTTALSASVVSRLAELVGPQHVIADPALCAAYEVDGMVPSAVVRPECAAEIAGVLHFAGGEELAVIPMGGRTKVAIGMPPRRYDLALDLSRMNRVLAYDPRDLTLGVEPAVRFSDLAEQLRAERQFLPMASSLDGRATLGGIIASGADSPWRYGYGSARDYLLGVEFVTGEGVPSKSGGRVVENVTGYDLHKLLIGSLGTLAVITRLNFRTFPLSPAQQTYIASFAEHEHALGLCEAIAASPLQPKILDVVDGGMARLFTAREAVSLPGDAWSVIATTAGPSEVVERYGRDLSQMVSDRRGQFTVTRAPDADALLGCVGDFAQIVFDEFRDAVIFRMAALPSGIPALLQQSRALAARHQLALATLVRSSRIVYAALVPREHDATGDALAASDGHADGRVIAAGLAPACAEWMETAISMGLRPMIEHCPLALKREWASARTGSIWPPLGDEQEIAERVKNVFDPRRTLAPGRFAGGI